VKRTLQLLKQHFKPDAVSEGPAGSLAIGGGGLTGTISSWFGTGYYGRGYGFSKWVCLPLVGSWEVGVKTCYRHTLVFYCQHCPPQNASFFFLHFLKVYFRALKVAVFLCSDPLLYPVLFAGASAQSYGATPQLSHDHRTQFTFVLQTLTLWVEVMQHLPKLWCLADEDLLAGDGCVVTTHADEQTSHKKD